ncbi:glycine zipper 2TM domain-containing protein [Ditylenchus destructor]|nr:glycine zipper 2TM domain-containing protein [Ditylenchus destructor]
MDVRDDRYGPEPQPSYYRRGDESLYQARVTSVHAVMGQQQQRCWIEQKEVRDRPNVGGAVIGGVLGGILGHQFGGGTGQAVTTAAGAVGGAVIGSNVNRNDTRSVQRCGSTDNGKPEYWDVRYEFRGQEHAVQLTQPPGASITVNSRGEPRI